MANITRCERCQSDNSVVANRYDNTYACILCGHEQTKNVQGALDAGEPHKLSIAGSNPAPATIISSSKEYHCKKCDFHTPDKRKIVGHYSSAHSWWHDPAKQEVETEKTEQASNPLRMGTVEIHWDGSFSLKVTIDEINVMSEDLYARLWSVIGEVVRQRAKRRNY